jgi:hypothetical protein
MPLQTTFFSTQLAHHYTLWFTGISLLVIHRSGGDYTLVFSSAISIFSVQDTAASTP